MIDRVRRLDFYLVDVFTREPLTGNPLPVIVDDAVVGAGAESEHAAALDEETMRRIAREFNQSETTFVLPPTRPEADWRLRFFTPTGAEVYGAGHNALGAWWWLATAGRASRERSSARIVTCMQQIGDRV